MDNEGYRKRIIEKAIELFNTEGCKAVTMDQLSASLHISKRTLYETFTNKEELILSCLTEVHRRIGEHRKEIYQRVDDPLLLTIYILKSTMTMNEQYAKLIMDAERYYPKLNEKILQIQSDKFQSALRGIFEQAAERGDLYDTVDIELAISMLTLSVRRLFEQTNSNKPDVKRAIINSIYIYLRGMLSVKAIGRYDSREEEFRQLLSADGVKMN
ncbi:MAG: TetR/AcrR family transcriptional regulator [Bacteroidales bacterium]|nr:TetR/AcrR family transcriptional regulator [Bacteroidales bacterium]